jgi:hypothetical protein
MANSVGNVTSNSITELDGAAPQPVPIATGILFEISPSNQRPDHPVGGTRAQSTETGDLVDTPLGDIQETLDDVEGARDYLGSRTLHALRQGGVQHDRKTLCHLHTRPTWDVDETHGTIEADDTRLSGVGTPTAALTFVTSGLRETGAQESVGPAATKEDSLTKLL